MKTYFLKLLKTFDYHSTVDFSQSLAPSTKYHLTSLSVFLSILGTGVDKLFGLDGFAFVALLIVFITELISGITASSIRKEQFSSMKLSRFSFKVAYYLVLIAVPYLMANSFYSHKKELPAMVFEWLHTFLVVQIVLENVVSILENTAVITGKDKTHIITKIQDKINQLFS